MRLPDPHAENTPRMRGNPRKHLRRASFRKTKHNVQSHGSESERNSGGNTVAYRTVNPYNNEVVATFDDLTDA